MADEKNEVVETTEEPAVEEKVEEKKVKEKKAAPSKNIEKILDSIEKMTVLEMAELVKALEDKFGVSAAAPMAMMAAPAAGAAAGADEEKTEWDVVLTETGEKKFQVVKVIRQVTDLGLKEAKDIVDNPGQVVKKEVQVLGPRGHSGQRVTGVPPWSFRARDRGVWHEQYRPPWRLWRRPGRGFSRSADACGTERILVTGWRVREH